MRAQRLLPFRQVARPAGQQLEPSFEPGTQLRRRQDLHARGGQLDRQRQAVQPAADVGDGVGVPRRQREVGPAGRGALHEQRDRRRIRISADGRRSGVADAGSGSGGTGNSCSP